MTTLLQLGVHAQKPKLAIVRYQKCQRDPGEYIAFALFKINLVNDLGPVHTKTIVNANASKRKLFLCV